METHDLLSDSYGRVLELLTSVLDGLSDEDIHWQPRPDCNSIGWLAWHLTRQHDAQIASLMAEEQLWLRDGWHQRFGRPADPEDIGFGDTAEQVAAFRAPDAATLLDYHKAVLDRSAGYFTTLSASDLDRELDEPWFQPLPRVGVRLISIVDEAIVHAGQAAYLRGLRHGKGWQAY